MSNEEFAKNPNTPPEALAMLSTSPSETVRLLVASNPNTPVAALRHLALDSDKAVREAVSRNPRTPYDAFTKTEAAAPSQIGPVDDAEVARVVNAAQTTTAEVKAPDNIIAPPAPHEIQAAIDARQQAEVNTASNASATVLPSVSGEVVTETSTPSAAPKSLWQRILAFFGF